MLLYSHMHVNADDQHLPRNTSLHFAAWQEREKSMAIIELLLRNHADPNERANDGSTPLHHAGMGHPMLCTVAGWTHT